MGIKANFNQEDVSRRFAAFLDVIVKKQIERLQYLGEMCVEHAKLIPANVGFTDQTGNLRSSIGYVVFCDGVAIHDNFAQVKEGNTGIKEGQKLAKTIGSKYPEGVVLVVTAGMNYALYVESKGRDVLTSAEHLAQQELPKMLQKLVSNIEKATTE